MKTYDELLEEREAIFKLHECDVTPEMHVNRKSEEASLMHFKDNLQQNILFTDLTSGDNFLHLLINSDYIRLQSNSWIHLLQITHPDDRRFSVETEIIIYDTLMALKACERQQFHAFYTRRLLENNGLFHYYLIRVSSCIYDKNGSPWMMQSHIARLPASYKPLLPNHHYFSHQPHSRPSLPTKLIRLKAKQKQILMLSNDDLTIKEIVALAGSNYHTVVATRSALMDKFEVHNIHAAYTMAKAFRLI